MAASSGNDDAVKYGASRQSGFTLLELLLVIGVGALILIGGILTYRTVTESSKATASIRKMMTIRQQARLAAEQQGGSYTGIAFNSTSGAGAADGGNSPLVIDGTLKLNERSPFNGEITVTPSGTGDANLTVTFGNISQAGCMRLMQAMTSSSELVSVGTGTATYTAAADQIPVTVANATAACNQSVNVVTWVLP